MNRIFRKHIDELLNAQVIDKPTADRISKYYDDKKKNSVNLLIMIFAIIGAALIGSGIILILAHNWDNFSRNIRTGIAFLPLVAAQALCLYTILKKYDSKAWREGCSVFLVFAVGASISMVSQIFHIVGDISQFLFIWMLICLPVLYIMKSDASALLIIAGITGVSLTAFDGRYNNIPILSKYFILLVGWSYYYLTSVIKRRKTVITAYFHLTTAISLLITLGHITVDHYSILNLVYFCAFSILILISELSVLKDSVLAHNMIKILGLVGFYIMTFTFSYADNWKHSRLEFIVYRKMLAGGELIWAGLVFILAVVLFYRVLVKNRGKWFELEYYGFIVFALLYFIVRSDLISMIVMNLYLLAISVSKIVKGLVKLDMKLMNFGLVIFSFQFLLRFFDSDIGFIYKGLVFIVIGIIFINANNFLIKRRRREDV